MTREEMIQAQVKAARICNHDLVYLSAIKLIGPNIRKAVSQAKAGRDQCMRNARDIKSGAFFK